MDELWQSTYPEKFTLLGQELNPLCLGHLLQLSRLDCLPVDSPEKLVTAVVVCSSQVSEIDSVLSDRWLEWKIFVWRNFLGEPNWQESFILWEDYYDTHTQTPEIFRQSTDEKFQSGSPWLWHLKVTLQAELNYTQEEALSCTYANAIWDYYTFHEIKGTIEIGNREEIEKQLKWLKENEKEILKEAQKMRFEKDGI